MLSFKPDNREPIFFLGAGAEVFYYWLITAPIKAVKANDENNLSQESEPKGFNKFKAGADQKERFPNTVGNWEV